MSGGGVCVGKDVGVAVETGVGVVARWGATVGGGLVAAVVAVAGFTIGTGARVAVGRGATVGGGLVAAVVAVAGFTIGTGARVAVGRGATVGEEHATATSRPITTRGAISARLNTLISPPSL